MQEILLVLIGTAVGTVILGAGFFFGSYTAMKSYEIVTNPYETIPKPHREDTDIDIDKEPYDWDEYESVLTPPLGDSGEEPKA